MEVTAGSAAGGKAAGVLEALWVTAVQLVRRVVRQEALEAA